MLLPLKFSSRSYPLHPLYLLECAAQRAAAAGGLSRIVSSFLDIFLESEKGGDVRHDVEMVPAGEGKEKKLLSNQTKAVYPDTSVRPLLVGCQQRPAACGLRPAGVKV